MLPCFFFGYPQVLEHDENDARCQIEAEQGTSCVGSPGRAWQVVAVGHTEAWNYSKLTSLEILLDGSGIP